MITKAKGDIAEYAAILRLLQYGLGVSVPVGDRLPYDLIADINGKLIKLQIKCAWFDSKSNSYLVDVRKTKTNRRLMLRDTYKTGDFDFALVYISELNIFYVFPLKVFISFGSIICMVESVKRQRLPKSANYREAFKLITDWAMH